MLHTINKSPLNKLLLIIEAEISLLYYTNT